jgi:hypothetical protein
MFAKTERQQEATLIARSSITTSIKVVVDPSLVDREALQTSLLAERHVPQHRSCPVVDG